MNETKSMKKNIIWNTFGSVFYSACQWLITIVVVRIAKFEAAGFLSLAMTTSSSFSAISLFSMRNYQVSDVTGEYSTNEYVGSRVISCVLAFVSCVLYASLTTSWYQMLCTTAFMLVRIAEAAVDVLNGVEQKYDRYDLIGKSYLLRGAATVASFTILLIINKNMVIALFAMAILNLLIAVVCDWRWTNGLEKIVPNVFNRRVLLLLKRCIPIVVFSFLLSLENLIPKNILQALEGTEELGIYSSIATPTLVVQVFASVAFNPFLPQFSYVYTQKEYEKFSKLLHKTYLVLLGLSAFVTLGAMLVGRIGLQILFGKDILQYYNLFMPIVWCTILTAWIWILSAIVIAIRQIKWLLVGMVVNFAMNLLIATRCITIWGKNGISIVQIITYALYIVFLVGVCEFTLFRNKRSVKIQEG